MALLTLSYFYWHYAKALPILVGRVNSALVFLRRLFSVSVLLEHFFRPWVHRPEVYPEDLNIPKIMKVFLLEVIMRLVGVVVRLAALILYFALQLAVLMLGLVVLLAWILLPITVVLLAAYVILLIF